MTDGKARRPEESAQREARSEHIPTPEGRGGEDALEAATRLVAWNTVNPDTLPSVGMALADAYVVARALLSSPRVERERALEEAIRAVDTELEDGSPEYTWDDSDRATDDARRRAIEAIRALSPPVG